MKEIDIYNDIWSKVAQSDITMLPWEELLHARVNTHWFSKARPSYVTDSIAFELPILRGFSILDTNIQDFYKFPWK